MKRVCFTFLASFVFLAVTSLTGYAAYFFNISNFWIMFGIASGVFVAGIALGFVKHVAAKIVAFFVNAVAMGFYLQSWYVNRGFDNSLWLMLGVAALAAAYMLVYVLPLFIPAVNRHYGVYLLIFVLLSLAGYVVLLCFTKTTWVSTLGFYGILQLSFIMGCSFSDVSDFDDQVQVWLVSSCSLLVCAALILMAALGSELGSDCSCDCDGGGCSPSEGISSPIRTVPKNKK